MDGNSMYFTCQKEKNSGVFLPPKKEENNAVVSVKTFLVLMI